MENIEKKIDDLAQITAKGFEAIDRQLTAIDARFQKFEARLEKIEVRLEALEIKLQGTNQRIDDLADKVAPVEQLIPLITEDFYKRFLKVEAHVSEH